VPLKLFFPDRIRVPDRWGAISAHARAQDALSAPEMPAAFFLILVIIHALDLSLPIQTNTVFNSSLAQRLGSYILSLFVFDAEENNY
jgi:hypothetical protein